MSTSKGDITLNFPLHPGQLEVVHSPARFNVLVAGRRYGKSHLACVRAIAKALEPANKLRRPVWIVAPVFPQAKQIYWRTLLDMVHPLVTGINSNEGRINLETEGGEVELGVKGADRPDSLRGVGLHFAVLDEFADMKPETWEQILRPALSDSRGGALFIGTPKGRNHFYELYEHAATGADPAWRAFHFPSVQNPFLPADEIAAAQSTMSSAAFRQEFLASFETGGSDVFKLDWLKYEEEPLDPKSGKPVSGDWYVCVDLAGFGEEKKLRLTKASRRDRTAIAIVKVLDDERWWIRDLVVGRWGVEETARRIIDAVASVETTNLGIERGALYNAVQPYLVNEARKRNIPLRVEPLTHANQKKEDRIVWALAAQAEHGRMLLRPAPWNRELEDEWAHFPSKMVHDDTLDALAFVAQLGKNRVFNAFAELSEEPYWEPQDRNLGW